MKAKCNHKCFECPYDDCIVETITLEERKEIRERDSRYFCASESKSIVKQKPGLAKHKGRYVGGRPILV